MAEIRNHNGRPAIIVDGKAYPPMMATIRTIDNDHLVLDKEYYKNLGKAGIRIFFLICDTEWLKPGAIRLFCEEAEALLEVVPDALIVPRIGMHPTNEWIEAHPDDCIRYSDGSSPETQLFSESYVTTLPHHYSLCSENWRRDAGLALEETWKTLMALPYADHIIGCFLAAGGTSEWYYMRETIDWDRQIALDHSESFRKNFQKYLTARYGSDENLQKHWKNPDATLEHPPIPSWEKHFYAHRIDKLSATPEKALSNAEIPSPALNGTSLGSIVDMDKNIDVYDFYRAWHFGSSESVKYFAHVIKTLTPDKLVGAFYGSQGCTVFFRDGTAGGTVNLLNCPDIDFLAAPGVYENREPGNCEGQREVQDSFTLHNKIYIFEQDTRTHMENAYFRNMFGVYDLTDSYNIMKREFGRVIAEDVQAWWFDQLLGGRRYKHPELLKLIEKQQEIAHTAYSLPREKSSEIAIIFDEESLQAVSYQTTRDLVEMHRNYEIAKIGAPVDQYYHNDLADPNMPSYKLYIFANTIVLTKEERRVIREKLARDKTVAVFLYAPGFIDPDADKKLDVAGIEALTGIHVSMDPEKHHSKLRIGDCKHPIVDPLDKRKIYGYLDRERIFKVGCLTQAHWQAYLYPMFYPDDPDATILGHFVDNGRPAAAVKKTDGFTSVFWGAKHLRCDVMKSLARYAGCHIWSDNEDTVYAGRNFVTVHAAFSGTRVLHFPKPCTPVEVYEGKAYGENVTEITLEMYLGETKMFRLD